MTATETRTPDLIVTRHTGALDWLSKHLPCPDLGGAVGHGLWAWAQPGVRCDRNWLYASAYDYAASVAADEDVYEYRPVVPVMAEVTADHVRGKHVVGNLPMHLAALCASVTVIEFDGAPPRGTEYTAEDMERAGARLARYTILTERESEFVGAWHDAATMAGVPTCPLADIPDQNRVAAKFGR